MNFTEQLWSNYRKAGQVKPGKTGFPGEVVADITTSFTVLLAIFFPSVTGILLQDFQVFYFFFKKRLFSFLNSLDYFS